MIEFIIMIIDTTMTMIMIVIVIVIVMRGEKRRKITLNIHTHIRGKHTYFPIRDRIYRPMSDGKQIMLLQPKSHPQDSTHNPFIQKHTRSSTFNVRINPSPPNASRSKILNGNCTATILSFIFAPKDVAVWMTCGTLK